MKWDLCSTCSVCVGPAACRCGGEWLSRAQRRAVADESKASLAREMVCGVPCPAQLNLLHSLSLSVSRDCPISTGSSAGSWLGEQQFLK